MISSCYVVNVTCILQAVLFNAWSPASSSIRGGCRACGAGGGD